MQGEQTPTNAISAILNGIRIGKTQKFMRGLANTQRQYEVAKEKYDAIVRQLQTDPHNTALQQAAASARDDLEKAYTTYQNFGVRDAKSSGAAGDKEHQSKAEKVWGHLKNFLVGPEHVPGNEFAPLPGVLQQAHASSQTGNPSESPGQPATQNASIPGNPPVMQMPKPIAVPGAGEVYAPPATMTQAGGTPGLPPSGNAVNDAIAAASRRLGVQ